MTRPRIAFVGGARPNFMKIAPVLRAVDEVNPPFEPVIVHTGQHYSAELSDVFFEQLGIRKPDVHLDAGSGTHGRQTARVLEAFETFLLNASARIETVMVVGDVNSTLAASLAAAKLHIPAVHLEAGLRSFDRTMPEEINRLVTDAVCDLLLVSEPAGEENLIREGIPPSRIRYVGNVMIDTLVQHLPYAEPNGPATGDRRFALVTLHRPSNVDSRESLAAICEFLIGISAELDIVFPVHPRTKSRLEEFGLSERLGRSGSIRLLPPLGYVENLGLMRNAVLVLTDSGGIQEETSYLSVPCLTLRENTERPVTLTLGTNMLVGSDFEKARQSVCEILQGKYRKGKAIPGWDGKAAHRVVAELSAFLENRHLVSPILQAGA